MANKRYFLKDVEAKLLGKNINQLKVGDRGRYRLNENDKKRLEQLKVDHNFFTDECTKLGIDPLSVSNYWHKGKHFSIHVKPNTNDVTIEELRDVIIKQMDEHSPTYHEIDYSLNDEDYLLVIDPADIHIGKLASSFETGEEYDSQIAVARVLDGVRGILKKSYGFGVNQIMLIGGNDVLHVDTPRSTTTAGTVQDTSGMWYDNFLMAKDLYIDIIELLSSVAPVHFVYNPSNHDYMSSFFLSDVLMSWFRNNDNVTFDCSMAHRKYFRYGNSLIGTTHGDGAKLDKLPLLMAQEAKEDWGTTKHRYIYTHHIHHKMAQDFIGITVESLRSPSSSDGWHHRNGYQHAPKAIEGFIHHPEHGQVARLTHLF